MSQTAAWAGMLGMARLSDPAIKFRLDKAVGFLGAIVERLLSQLVATSMPSPLQGGGHAHH